LSCWRAVPAVWCIGWRPMRSPGRHQLWSLLHLNQDLHSRMGLWRWRPVWAPMLPPCRFGRWMCFKMRCGSVVRNAGHSSTWPSPSLRRIRN